MNRASFLTGSIFLFAFDVGDRLNLPDTHFDFGSEGPFTITGKLGQIDGHPVLFAEHLSINSKPGEGTSHGTKTPQ